MFLLKNVLKLAKLKNVGVVEYFCDLWTYFVVVFWIVGRHNRGKLWPVGGIGELGIELGKVGRKARPV